MEAAISDYHQGGKKERLLGKRIHGHKTTPRSADMAYSEQFEMSPMLLPKEQRRKNFLIANVSGVKFMLAHRQLGRLPDSRLCKLLQEQDTNRLDFIDRTPTVMSPTATPTSADQSTNTTEEIPEYYFPRNPDIFRNIVDLYTTGELHLNQNWCGASVVNELRYWKISENLVSDCCRKVLTEYQDEIASSERLHKVFNSGIWDPDVKHRTEKWSWLRKTVWTVLDNPTTFQGKVWKYIRLIIIFISIVLMIIRTTMLIRGFDPGFNYTTLENVPEGLSQKEWMYRTTYQWPWTYYVDYACTIIFTIEFALRLAVCYNKVSFMKSALNVIDMICMIADWYIMLRRLIRFKFPFYRQIYAWCYTLKVFRIARIFRSTSKYSGLRILLLAMKASLSELVLMVMIMTIGVITFSVLIYNTEFDTPDMFLNIPQSCWYAIVTMTTVGYGDESPKTSLGKVVGSIAALSGIIFISLLIPIIAKNFTEYYRYADELREKDTGEEIKEEHSEYKETDKLLKTNPRQSMVAIRDTTSRDTIVVNAHVVT